MATIRKQITTKELIEKLENIKDEQVGITNNRNLYVQLNGEYYLVLHNGEKIPVSSSLKSKQGNIYKEINDEDVFNRLLAIARQRER